MTHRGTGLAIGLLAAAALAVADHARGDEPSWTFHGKVADGNQLDVVRGPGNTIHLVSTKYYRFDAGGARVAEEGQGDERQGSMDFGPAIAVCGDGSVHIVTRHGGDWGAGHDIRHRKRDAGGSWSVDYVFGGRWARNYVVGIGCAATGQVVMFYSEAGDNVWGDLHLWEAGSSSAADLGRLGGIWRADTDARIRGFGDAFFMVSGKVDGDGRAYFLRAAAGAGVRDALDGSAQEHRAGTGRRGFPDLFVDAAGKVHVAYGAQHTVFYNSYTSGGTKVHAADIKVFDGLGDWHCASGLSAVAASDDGRFVVAVALKSDGSQGASDSDLLWSRSEDGGSTWSAQQDTGRNTDGGEGRHRPRLVAIGGKFFLFYVDKETSGVSLATLDLGGAPAEPEEEAAAEPVAEPEPETPIETMEPVEEAVEPTADAADTGAADDATHAEGAPGAVTGGCGCTMGW